MFTDINECLLPNPPCPTYICENTMGGYLCGGVSRDPELVSLRPIDDDRCPPGFRVGGNEECEGMSSYYKKIFKPFSNVANLKHTVGK